MKALLRVWLLVAALAIPAGVALADAQSDTIRVFRHAGEAVKVARKHEQSIREAVEVLDDKRRNGLAAFR